MLYAAAPRTALHLLGPWAPPRAATVTIAYHDGRSEDVTEEELHSRFGARVVKDAARYSILEWVDRARAVQCFADATRGS